MFDICLVRVIIIQHELNFLYLSIVDMSGDKKADVGAGSSTDFQFVSTFFLQIG